MKVYLLWYRQNAGERPHIVCALRDYDKGEQQAQQAHFELSLQSIEPFEMGITRTLMNRVILDIDTEETTWVIYKDGKWDLDTDC